MSTVRGGLFRVEDGELRNIIKDSHDAENRRISHLFVFNGGTYFIREGKLTRLTNGKAVEERSPAPALSEAFEREIERAKERGRVAGVDLPRELSTRAGGRWEVKDATLVYRQPGDEEALDAISLGKGSVALDLLEDREGNLWVATRGQGLVRILQSRVRALKAGKLTYEHSAITAMHTRNGDWWIARSSGGLDRISNGRLEPFELYGSNILRTVVSMLEDQSGRLWFATRHGSVFYRDQGAFSPAFPRLGMSKIRALAEDSRGRIWFGGYGCLYCWDGQKVEDFSDLISSDREDPEIITTVVPGASSQLWLGTLRGHFYSLERNENGKLAINQLGRVGEISDPHVSSIFPMERGELWLTTIRSGLYLWKDHNLLHFGRDDGIPDERLTGLHRTDEDDFWIGSLGGILHVSRHDLLAWKRSGQKRPKWQRFDRSDGMATRECIGGGQPGIIVDEGRLWFPTGEGLAGVAPAKIQPNAAPPRIYFAPVSVNGIAQPLTPEGILVGPGRTSLGFQFTGISLTAPEEVTYQVRMRGLHDEIRHLGTQGEVTYAALPPGQYTFEVLASNGDGVATPEPVRIPITIEPLLWQKPWFVAAAVVCILLASLLLGAFLMRLRTRRKLQEILISSALQNERSRISRDLHDDLGASLTELAILTELAAEDPKAAPVLNSLGELSLKSKRAVGSLDEIVWATSPEQDHLRSLVEYLSFFARDFLKTVDLPLHLNLDEQIPEIAIGPRRRHHMILATREALNNAVKYSGTEKILLAMTIKNEGLEVSIRDFGKGFDPMTIVSGNGVANIRKRMTDCGGYCHIESSPGHGTTVTLFLPLLPS